MRPADTVNTCSMLYTYFTYSTELKLLCQRNLLGSIGHHTDFPIEAHTNLKDIHSELVQFRRSTLSLRCSLWSVTVVLRMGLGIVY